MSTRQYCGCGPTSDQAQYKIIGCNDPNDQYLVGTKMTLVGCECACHKWLGELLAVIHCDGGHYRSEHGTEKAVKDAITKRTEMVMRIDQLETELAAEREKHHV